MFGWGSGEKSNLKSLTQCSFLKLINGWETSLTARAVGLESSIPRGGGQGGVIAEIQGKGGASRPGSTDSGDSACLCCAVELEGCVAAWRKILNQSWRKDELPKPFINWRARTRTPDSYRPIWWSLFPHQAIPSPYRPLPWAQWQQDFCLPIGYIASVPHRPSAGQSFPTSVCPETWVPSLHPRQDQKGARRSGYASHNHKPEVQLC